MLCTLALPMNLVCGPAASRPQIQPTPSLHRSDDTIKQTIAVVIIKEYDKAEYYDCRKKVNKTNFDMINHYPMMTDDELQPIAEFTATLAIDKHRTAKPYFENVRVTNNMKPLHEEIKFIDEIISSSDHPKNVTYCKPIHQYENYRRKDTVRYMSVNRIL